MKKSSAKKGIKIFRIIGFLLVMIVSAQAFAESDPNRLIAFKKVYLEPVQDNVDGAMKAPIEETFKEVFDRNPRFEIVSDRNLADSILTTVVTKKTSGLEVVLTLTLTATKEIFSEDKTTILSNATGKDSRATVKELLKTTLKRIPFYGTVTGRDGNELTFDIGAAHALRTGDVIQISRIDNIKRHPLLKSIVDVQLVPVGSAAIDQVEDTIAFGHVHNEISGEKIQRLYKVTAIEARLPEIAKKQSKINSSEVVSGAESESSSPISAEAPSERPEIGYASLAVPLGSFSSSSSQGSTSPTYSGSAFNPGFRLSGELWLTKNWFFDGLVGYSTMSYFQTQTTADAAINPPGVSASTRTLGFDAGYRYLPYSSVYGPNLFLKLGYYNFNWSPTVSAADLLSPKTYSGLNLGIGGGLPLRAETTGLLLSINILLFPSMSEDSFKTGPEPSASGVNFYLGGYHFISPKIAFRAGVSFEIHSADFGKDSTSGTTSQKFIGFVPALLYYF